MLPDRARLTKYYPLFVALFDKVENDRDLLFDRAFVKGWLEEVRRPVALSIYGACVACDRRFDRKMQLHHGIVEKNEIRGVRWESLIHHLYNLFPVHDEACHIALPDRETLFDIAAQKYGRDDVTAWYRGLPWKSGKPPYALGK